MATNSLVVLDYERLFQPYDDELDAQLEKAYGMDGLGLAVIKNVPKYPEMRQELLPKAFNFAALPDEVKKKYESPDTYYSFGWSHGKERLLGKPDVAKGSYYNNPQYNVPTEDEELIKQHPAVMSPNIWPSKEDFPQGLEDSFMQVGGLIADVAKLLAKVLDIYCQKRNNQLDPNFIQKMLEQSKTAKARLLYYFPWASNDDTKPNDTNEDNDDEAWCGFHNDNGAITGLQAAMFFDKDGQQIPNPDPSAGLYIKNRRGELIQAKFPADCLAFQMGESIQILSGGLLLATPHYVKPTKVDGVSRATMACFLQPNHDVPMQLPPGTKRENFERGIQAEFLPPGVPPLAARFEERSDQDAAPQTYAEFAQKTFSMYY